MPYIEKKSVTSYLSYSDRPGSKIVFEIDTGDEIKEVTLYPYEYSSTSSCYNINIFGYYDWGLMFDVSFDPYLFQDTLLFELYDELPSWVGDVAINYADIKVTAEDSFGSGYEVAVVGIDNSSGDGTYKILVDTSMVPADVKITKMYFEFELKSGTIAKARTTGQVVFRYADNIGPGYGQVCESFIEAVSIPPESKQPRSELPGKTETKTQTIHAECFVERTFVNGIANPSEMAESEQQFMFVLDDLDKYKLDNNSVKVIGDGIYDYSFTRLTGYTNDHENRWLLKFTSDSEMSTVKILFTIKSIHPKEDLCDIVEAFFIENDRLHYEYSRTYVIVSYDNIKQSGRDDSFYRNNSSYHDDSSCSDKIWIQDSCKSESLFATGTEIVTSSDCGRIVAPDNDEYPWTD